MPVNYRSNGIRWKMSRFELVLTFSVVASAVLLIFPVILVSVRVEMNRFLFDHFFHGTFS